MFPNAGSSFRSGKNLKVVRHSSFGFLSSFVIRHSSFERPNFWVAIFARRAFKLLVMSSASSELDDQTLRFDKAQHDNPQTLADLRDKSHEALLNILLSRGASRTDAQDVLADVWADCVPGMNGRASLLDKFSGKCTLQGWLATVATNRWLDLKRRQARQVEITQASHEAGQPDPFDRVAAVTSSPKEDILISLLRESLADAFARCSPEGLVLLRLVHMHGCTQREMVRMLGWHESKVSRFLSEAMRQIEQQTLAELKRRDPWLELSWQDFVDLCETHQTGFM